MPTKEISIYYSTSQHLHLINKTRIWDKEWCVPNITKTWFTCSEVWHKGDFTPCSMHTWLCYFSAANSKCHRVLFNQLYLLLSVLALQRLSPVYPVLPGKLWDCCFLNAGCGGMVLCATSLMEADLRAEQTGAQIIFFFSSTRFIWNGSAEGTHFIICWLQLD